MPPARVGLWIASVAGIALLLRSLLIAPIPAWAAVAALLLYVAYSTLGVIVPQLEMFGDVIKKGDACSAGVALTFDDGPHPETTRRVLEVLAARGAKGTFFVVGRKVRAYPDVVREIALAGHSLALHGYEHERLYSFKSPRAVFDDIRRTQAAIEEACGRRPVLFRPPIGYIMPRTAAGARRAGVALIAWSVRGIDGIWRADPAKVARRIERGLEAGAIVLLHDASEHEKFVPATVEALPSILDAIERRGLRTLTIEQMLELPTAPTAPSGEV